MKLQYFSKLRATQQRNAQNRDYLF